MIRFYSPDIAHSGLLSETESGHAVRVLRHTEGDIIEVVDGAGGLHRCRIAAAHPRHTAVEIIESVKLPKVWAADITLAIAPTKNMDRMEWLVEKLVEIGIDRIVPVICTHSERRDIKRERLEKIAVSAMKQSLKAVLPQIDEAMPLSRFLDEDRGHAAKYVGYCDADTERRLLAREYTGGDVRVLIGPEGDFSPAEITAAVAAGYIPVTLGDNRLRTETAALTAIDTFHIVNMIRTNI